MPSCEMAQKRAKKRSRNRDFCEGSRPVFWSQDVSLWTLARDTNVAMLPCLARSAEPVAHPTALGERLRRASERGLQNLGSPRPRLPRNRSTGPPGTVQGAPRARVRHIFLAG